MDVEKKIFYANGGSYGRWFYEDQEVDGEGYVSEYERTISQLIAFFKLILADEAGLAILLGDAPAPSTYDLYIIKSRPGPDLGTYVQGGDNGSLAETVVMATEEENSMLRRLGSWGGKARATEADGWARIRGAVRDYAKNYPEGWRLIKEHSLFIRPGGVRHDGNGGFGAWLCQRHGNISRNAMNKRRDSDLRILARYVLSWSPEDCSFDLRS